MATAWIFIDEHGNTKFGGNSSTHFGLAAITTQSPGALCSLLDGIRHNVWSSSHIPDGWFHAQRDCPTVRQAVFEAFAKAPIVSCDVVSLSKERIYPELREPRHMYRAALRVLLRYVIRHLTRFDDLRVVAAQWAPVVPDLRPLLRETLTQPGYHHPRLWSRPLEVMQAPASAHAGLQLADYLAWASQRKRSRPGEPWLEMTQRQGRGFSDFLAF